MSDIFNEVDDEIRQEKIQQFWQDNKYFIIMSIIAAILFTAGFGWWQNWKRTTFQAETAAFYQALNTSDIENLINYTKEAKGEHAAFARLSAASLLLNQHRTGDAITMLQEIQTDKNISKIYRNFALLLEAEQQLNTADDTTLSQLEKNLIPLTDTRSAWRLSAQEMLVLIARKQGDIKKSILLIDSLLTMPGISKKMNARITQLKALYTAQLANPPATKGEENN